MAADLPAILAMLRKRGVETFALQEARTRGTSPAFQESARTWDIAQWRETWNGLVKAVESAQFHTSLIRPA